MITREFNLYLHAGHSIPLVINVNQYDRGEQWLFTLFNADGTQYVPSSGAIVGIKSDNLGIINSGTVDSQGRVVINETQQMTAAVGKAVFELVIDDGTHGTANFVMLVEPKPGDNADLSESDISMIEEAIEAAANIKPYGSPLVASTVAGMTDHDKVYVYTGSETGYTSGHWYYYDGDSWEDGGVYNSVAVQTDTTLTLSGVAADAKKTGDEISDLKREITQLEAIPRSVKLAMDTLFQNMIFKNTDVYTDELATFHAWASAINVVSISAVFAQTKNYYPSDSLNRLKDDLIVTASFDDGTTAVISAYTLSGTLAVGTSTITVTSEGKTASFEVTVSKGFYYSPSMGLLTEQSYLNISDGGTAFTLTEEVIDNDYLRMYSPKASAWGSKYFDFVPSNFTNSASLKAVFKVVSLAWINASNTNNAGNFSFVLSNGSQSASFGVARRGSMTATPKVIVKTSSTNTDIANFILGTWHTLEMRVENGAQTVILDGTALLENQSLGDLPLNRFTYNSSNVSEHEIHFRSIEFTSD